MPPEMILSRALIDKEVINIIHTMIKIEKRLVRKKMLVIYLAIMIFDTNVLNEICKYIDDPTTFINFALICSKARYVAKLNKRNKMDQFCKKKGFRKGIQDADETRINFTVSRLPNGSYHGLQKAYYHDSNGYYDYYYYLYNYGILAAEWKGETGNKYKETYYNNFDRVIISYQCDCTRDVVCNYEGIDFNQYDFYMESKEEYKCNRCNNIGILEKKLWFKKENEINDADKCNNYKRTLFLKKEYRIKNYRLKNIDECYEFLKDYGDHCMYGWDIIEKYEKYDGYEYLGRYMDKFDEL